MKKIGLNAGVCAQMRGVGVVLGAFLGLAATSCGAADSSEGEASVVSAEQPLFVRPGTLLWNDNNLGTGVGINVCWAVRPRKQTDGVIACPNQTSLNDCKGNPISATTRDSVRALIRREIENTWQRYGNVEFLNWGDCPVNAQNQHDDAALARTIVMQMNTSDVTNILGKSNSFLTLIDYNFQAMAAGGDRFNLVHEMGHALGFEHEWFRRGFSDSRCTDANKGTTDPLFALTSFVDVDSKMNYCGNSPADNAILSPGDIIGLQKAYGRKPDGSIVGYRGQCVDIQGGSTANGTPTIAFPCRGTWNDTFFRNPSTTFEWFQTGTNSKCLNVSGGTAPNAVISWPCTNTENERFTTTGVEWRGMGNMCVEAVSGKLQLRACNGSSSQKWDFFNTSSGVATDQIRSWTGTCVSASTTTGALGQELILATCSTSDTKQRFNNPGKGVLTLKNNTGLCANVSGGLPTPNSKIVLWDGCGGTPVYNAQFILSGKIRSLGHCVETQGDGGVGQPIRAQACNSSNTTTQIWEYYL